MIRTVAFIVAAFAALSASAQESDESGSAEWDVPPYRIVLKTTLDAGHLDELTVYSTEVPIYHLSDDFVRSELTIGQETIADDRGKPVSGHDPEKVPGTDVLGIGRPNLVFADYSGGMHCCFKAIILMLDKPFRVQEIDLHDPGGNFHPVEGRTSLVLEATDATFKEWRSSFADSPFPPVMLSYDPVAGRYVADPDLMRAPLPAPEELARQKGVAREAHGATLADGPTDYEPGFLTSPMLDLIYTGHMTEAHAFLVDSWADSVAKRDAYWSLLTRCKLRESPYWPAVAKLNGLPATPPAADCPNRL